MRYRIPSVLVLALLATAPAVGTAQASWPTTWAGSGPGMTTVVSDGSASDPEFTYAHQPASDGAWQFSTVATSTGPVSIDYLYTGFHAYFNVRTYLRAFVTRAGVTTRTDLVNAGPSNCCTPPSGGFTYTGTVPLDVESGDTYGFEFGGSHSDGDTRLLGTLAVGKPGLNLVLAPSARTAAGEPTTLTATASLAAAQAASFVPLVLTSELPSGLSLVEDPVATGWDCTASTDIRLSCSTGGGRVGPGTSLPAIPLELVSATKAEYPIEAQLTGSWAHNTAANTTVGFGNRPPTAVDDAAATPKDTPLTLSVTANDSDPDGDDLTVSGNTAPTSGTASCSGGSCTYTPDAQFTGSDAFTYTLSDGDDGVATADAIITVTPPDVPAAAADSATTPEESPVSIAVTANDVLGTEPSRTSLATAPAHGTATCAGTECGYTPASDYSGSDTFTYTLTDADGDSSTAAVTVTITPVNDAPALAPLPNEGTVGKALPPLAATDADGDRLTYRVVDGSLPAGVSLNADGTFAGTPTAAGITIARVRACDPSGACDEKELRLAVGGSVETPVPLDTLPRTGDHSAPLLSGTGLALLGAGLLLRRLRSGGHGHPG